ncbi:MAG: ATP-grasp domain-containing protein [Proteobacteria bacterium]|nr:ATP-grasp domain-containing protein [Pseudomonadota bacterium]MBU1716981.1 ATP-grasp domain-containing protein [Pseudomonadota bacterium]
MRYNNSKLLVVGTTPDYIDLIRKSNPDRAIFLTNSSVRERAREQRPETDEEILCDLSDIQQTQTALLNFLCEEKITIDSICCFDCEAMELAATIASDFSLSYPSIKAIHNCRDKFASKQLWREQGLSCPETALINSDEDIDSFQSKHTPCVIKPLSGTGSEMVAKCKTREDSRNALRVINDNFKQKNSAAAAYGFSPEILAEEFIDGPEYSCDFILENSRAEIIRLTRKIPAQNAPFGTIRGYILAEPVLAGIDPQQLKDILVKSAKALGLERAICMLDFIVRNGEIVLIELSPRPGGDCLPFMLRHVAGLDVLTMALDFAQEREIFIFHDKKQVPHACIRLHAAKPGILKKITIGNMPAELGVIKVQILKTPGHVINMPPADYDSWLLGHIIFKCANGLDPVAQADKIVAQLAIEIIENHEN